MQSLVVTGTDTDVGKTYVSCLLLTKLRAAGVSVGAWKPVCSGSTVNEAGALVWNDVELLRHAIGHPDFGDHVCPQTFNAAVAPNIAAEMEGRVVNDDLLLKGPVDWIGKADFVVVEGAGGLLSPLSNALTTADIAQQLAAPILIVAANRLGMINHTLMTVEVALQRGLPIAAIVVNTISGQAADDSCDSNLRQLQRRLPSQLFLSVQADATDLRNVSGDVLGLRPLKQLWSGRPI